MKRAIICLFLLGCLYCPIILGQIVKCNDMNVGLIPIPQEDTEFADFKYRVQVKMNLSVSNIKNDTLVLKTTIKAAQGLEPRNLKAFLVNDQQEKTLLPSFVQNIPGDQPFKDVQLLNIVLPGCQNPHLVVHYDVIGTGFFFYLFEQNYPNVLAYYPREESIYPIDIPIKEVRVSAPDDMLVFCGLRDDSGVHHGEVNLTFINKDAFKKEATDWGDLKLNTYIPDSIVNNTIYRQQIDKFYSYINNLSAYVKVPKALDIILVRWRDEKTRNAFGVSLGNHSIFDIKFPAEGMLHEVIHQAFPHEVLDMSGGEYFIKESIVEWFALLLSGQLEKIDMSLIETTDVDLYDIHINNSKTWPSIYELGPAILQNIATKSGEEVFASAIISFFLEKEGKVTNYAEFLNHLCIYLPETTVEELDSMVKGGS